MISVAYRIATLAALLALAASPTKADGSKSRLAGADPYMRVYGQAAPPYAFLDFCVRHPQECVGQIDERRFVATPDRMAELDEINRVVNAAIEPATDFELYRIEDYWTLPQNGKGDCEDYALLKRHILMKRGWPASSLLITVVRDENGDGHAILTARVAHGDFILDNKVPDVKPWSKAGYRYVMRQSYINPRVWMSLDPKDQPPPLALSGLKQRQ